MQKRLSLALIAALLLTPALAQSATSTAGTRSATAATGTRATGGLSMNMTAVNVNTATLAQFERIPGMTSRLAQAVIAARAKGPFKGEQDFVKRVKGIGTRNVKKFGPYLKFS